MIYTHPVVNAHGVRILPEENIIKRKKNGTERHGEHVQDDSEDSGNIFKLFWHFDVCSKHNT